MGGAPLGRARGGREAAADRLGVVAGVALGGEEAVDAEVVRGEADDGGEDVGRGEEDVDAEEDEERAEAAAAARGPGDGERGEDDRGDEGEEDDDLFDDDLLDVALLAAAGCPFGRGPRATQPTPSH